MLGHPTNAAPNFFNASLSVSAMRRIITGSVLVLLMKSRDPLVRRAVEAFAKLP
jgi:hypothetical protein